MSANGAMAANEIAASLGEVGLPEPVARATIARLTPRRRKPARVMTHVTAHTVESVRSSSRPSHGTRNTRTSPSYDDRGPTAHQPTGSGPR